MIVSQLQYCKFLESDILETGNNWFLYQVQSSIREVISISNTCERASLTYNQSSCLGVLEVANSSVQKLREMSDAKHFCHKVTLPKMLALLKQTFIERSGTSGVALRDRILSMDDGFEFLLRTRSQPAALAGLSKIYDLCTGRVFSEKYETDPVFVKKLAEVGMHCEVLSGILIECTLVYLQNTIC